MKKTSNSLLNQLSNTEIEMLTNVVKETIATGLNESKNDKPFTAADLWSIQRQGRQRTTRRFI